MVPWGWSVALTAVGILGIYLSGSKRKAGWAVGLGAQVLWVIYAIATSQWGFLLSAFAYGWVYSRNWLKWRREEKAPEVNSGHGTQIS